MFAANESGGGVASTAAAIAKPAVGAVDNTAAGFLRLIDPTAAAWCFRTFPDAGTGPGHNFTGPLADHAAVMSAESASGRGVFVVINAGGHTGREIDRVRAVFADTDGAPLEPILACALPPSLVVETSPGRWHCYWLCDGLPLAAFRDVQRAIAARFGTDASVCDLPRVMRLPGFLHVKREPFAVRVIHASAARYAAAQVLAEFPPIGTERAKPMQASAAGVVIEETGTRHADLVSLAARLARAGISQESAAATVHAEADRGRWSRDIPDAEIAAAVASAYAKLESGELPRALDPWDVFAEPGALPAGARPVPDASAPLLRSVELGDVMQSHLDAPRFVVDRLIPCGHLTLFGSHGGSGKSILALAIAAHVAAGRPWAGFAVQHRPVLLVSLEDAGNVVRDRLRRVLAEYGLDPAAVAANLRIVDGSAGPTELMVESVSFGTRAIVATSALAELRAMVGDAGLIIVDNASDAYGGQENDRRQVRAFIRELAGLGRAQNAGVLLLAHIDKAAARFGSNGNSYSGSSAWHNSARSRLALVGAGDGVELVQEKLNLGRAAGPVRLAWSEHGVLIPTAASEPPDTRTDADIVLAAIAATIAAGVNVPTARYGSKTARHVLHAELSPLLRSARGKDDFWEAILKLQRDGKITMENYRTDARHERERFVIAANAPNAPNTALRATAALPQQSAPNAPL